MILTMNQDPRRISLMEKKEGQKSRDTFPLNGGGLAIKAT
jgi:hypothetical protein